MNSWDNLIPLLLMVWVTLIVIAVVDKNGKKAADEHVEPETNTHLTMDDYRAERKQERKDFYRENSSANCAEVHYPLMQRWRVADVCVEKGIVLTFWTRPMTNEVYNRYAKPVVDSLKAVDRHENYGGW